MFQSFRKDGCARPRETRSGGVGTLGGRKYNFLISLTLDRDRTERSLWMCQTSPALASERAVPNNPRQY